MPEQTASDLNKTAAAPKKADTIRVRVKYGRLLLRREKAEDSTELVDVYAETGEEVEVSRKWAEKLLGRTLEGYPAGATGAPGRSPGIIRDSPIELVQ